MNDWVRLRQNLYLGSSRLATYADWLSANGITVILNVATEVTDPDCGVTRQKVGLADNNTNTMAQVQLARDTLNTLLDAGQVIYLHDLAGLSRAPYIAVSVLAKREGKSCDEIFSEIRALLPGVYFPERLRPLYG